MADYVVAGSLYGMKRRVYVPYYGYYIEMYGLNGWCRVGVIRQNIDGEYIYWYA